MIPLTTMLVYCDDPSHTASPVGPIITDPNLVVPEDVYLDAEFGYVPEPEGPFWVNSGWRNSVRQVGPRVLRTDGQERELLDDGTVLPSRRHWTSAQKESAQFDGTREKWNPRCEWCSQRGGRWTGEDRDEVFSRLAASGVIGVSLRQLDLIKHAN